MIPREPEKSPEPTGEDSKTEPDQNLEEALSAAKKQAEDYLDSWKRAQADFINYKRRTEQEKLETGKYANSQLILSILPVLDDFERAFASVTPRLEKLDWIKGIKLIAQKLTTTLEAQGLTSIKAVGEPFDPNLHEAVMHSKGEDGKVVQELRKGYKLNDKVIRPSNVAVGNGEPLQEKKDEQDKDD
jgi:molecular chaperone GrpE